MFVLVSTMGTTSANVRTTNINDANTKCEIKF